MSYPNDFEREYARDREIDRRAAEYEAGSMLPFVGILGALILGIVVYSYAFRGETSQTASRTLPAAEQVDRPAAPPAPMRTPAETTGSGSVR